MNRAAGLENSGAGEGNRTLVISLGSYQRSVQMKEGDLAPVYSQDATARFLIKRLVGDYG